MIRRFLRLTVVVVAAAVFAGLLTTSTAERVEAQTTGPDYVGIPIMSPSRVSGAQLAKWFKSVPKNVNYVYSATVPVETLAQLYIDIGNEMGIRGDFAFVQGIHETAWYSFYNSMVLPEDNNFAGIGACNSCTRGNIYASAAEGVRAHLQHLDCYANPNTAFATRCPASVPAAGDRPFTMVRGHLRMWGDLNGVWAYPGKTYAQSILKNYNAMLTYNGLTPECPTSSGAINDAWGYYLVSDDGGVFSFGSASFYGSTGNMRLNQPVINIAATGSGAGYWLLAKDGGVFSFGDAQFYGSMGATPLNAPVIAMTTTPSGRGYWLLASDGGIFSFGDAQFWGSTGAMRLNAPVVGMARTPSGNGYWLVASDGGIFSFGDAEFYGSTGGMTLNAPVISMAAAPNAAGYHLLAADGGIFTFGQIQFSGSLGSCPGRRSLSMAMTPSGGGYWILTDDGRVTPFGDAPYFGAVTSANRLPIGIAVKG